MGARKYYHIVVGARSRPCLTHCSFIAVILCTLFLSFPVHAQETAPGDACVAGETDYIRQVGGPETSGVVHLMRCDGTNWQQYYSIETDNDFFTYGRLFFDEVGVKPAYIQMTSNGDNSESLAFWTRYGGYTKDIEIFRRQILLAPNGTGNVGVGTSSPGALMHVEGATGPSGSHVIIRDDAAYNANPLSVLEFQGQYLSNTSTAGFGTIVAGKENTTDGDRSGYMAFRTSSSGSAPSERLRIDSAGNVGIGTTTPQAELDVVGDIFYSGVLRDVSDKREKKSIRPLSGSLDKMNQLQGVSFVMKNDDKNRRELGFIAQDVQKVFPNLVDVTSDGRMGLSYSGFIAPMAEAIKELDAKNTALENENAELRQMIHKVNARMDVIEGKRRPPLKPYNN